jgi:hypothetical protein
VDWQSRGKCNTFAAVGRCLVFTHGHTRRPSDWNVRL